MKIILRLHVKALDGNHLFDPDLSANVDIKILQSMKRVNDTIVAQAKDAVPMNGIDTQDLDADLS